MENNKAVTATLIAHAGSVEVLRSALVNIPTPEATRTHTPIAHWSLLDSLESVLTHNSLKIVEEKYSVMSNGQKLFGVMKLQHITMRSRDDYRMALGIRASNDKVFPVQLIVGANVFVCDNLAFNGSVIALRKRHSGSLDIMSELQAGIVRAIEGYRGFSTQITTWQGITLSDESAKALILDAAVKEVMPLHLIPNVLKAYQEPPHVEFEPRTMWSLHNAFTEGFKMLKPHVAMESATKLAGLLQAA